MPLKKRVNRIVEDEILERVFRKWIRKSVFYTAVITSERNQSISDHRRIKYNIKPSGIK